MKKLVAGMVVFAFTFLGMGLFSASDNPAGLSMTTSAYAATDAPPEKGKTETKKKGKKSKGDKGDKGK